MRRSAILRARTWWQCARGAAVAQQLFDFLLHATPSLQSHGLDTDAPALARRVSFREAAPHIVLEDCINRRGGDGTARAPRRHIEAILAGPVPRSHGANAASRSISSHSSRHAIIRGAG